jgi:hypothetical protein
MLRKVMPRSVGQVANLPGQISNLPHGITSLSVNRMSFSGSSGNTGKKRVMAKKRTLGSALRGPWTKKSHSR